MQGGVLFFGSHNRLRKLLKRIVAFRAALSAYLEPETSGDFMVAQILFNTGCTSIAMPARMVRTP